MIMELSICIVVPLLYSMVLLETGSLWCITTFSGFGLQSGGQMASSDLKCVDQVNDDDDVRGSAACQLDAGVGRAEETHELEVHGPQHELVHKNGHEEAVPTYQIAADHGLPSAQNNLGIGCLQGNGVLQDVNAAVQLFRLAADQGHAGAQYNLGTCYEDGVGVVKNVNEAVRWYRLAAEQGCAKAQNSLGICYEVGNGTGKDFSEAVNWYRLAAVQGYAKAQNNIGMCYQHGTGVAEDIDEAVRWFRLAAAQGCAEAQYNLGMCYDWPVVVIVYVLVIVIDAIVLPIISPLGWPVLLIGLFGFAVTLISYSAVACSDPGIIYDTETRNVNSDSPRNSHDLESGPLVQNQEMQTQELLGSGAPHSAVYAVTPSVAFNARTESGESLRVLKNDEPADRNNQSSSVPATTNEASSTVNHSVVSASSPQLQIPLQVNGVSTSNVMQCGQCEIIRPKTARHCNYCGVCVDHLDHHCPCKYTIGLVSCTSVYHIFVCESIGCGKCIGKKNIKAFHVFVSAVCFQMYFLGGALIYYIVSVFAKWPHGPKA
jgi:hypothetical protein